ncbi:MAG: FimB/Mfa2 family fimbrial subunit [Muribaculaceae bacterium]|nr:FimB/Mfa2 family fimbrial subunit [Muribaculaceae bacterium]
MKLLNRNIFAIMAATAGLLTSCSDDIVVRENNVSDSENGVVIYIPQVPEGVVPEESGTRAGSTKDFNATEGAIKNIRLFAYADGKDIPVTYELTTECTKISNTGDPDFKTGYRLDLENGEYRCYVVANTAFSDPETIKEEDLLKMTATVPADIAATGLPMSCTHSDLLTRDNNGNYTPAGNGTITVNSGVSTRIKANLKFAVAKVRVTVLNDLHPADMVNAFYVDGHSDASAMLRDGQYTPGQGSRLEPAGGYKRFPATLPADDLKNLDVENLGDITASATSPWAWQTVFYVPEQLDQSQNATTAHIQIGNVSLPLPINHTDAVKGKIVERSHFYDYIGTSDGKFILDVQQWSPIAMIGALNGPTILDIDKTGFTITAGETVDITYKSNAPVTADCESFGLDKIYDITVSPVDEKTGEGHISITLNPAIDHAEFNTIKEGNDWKYFKLFAGPLVKKVDVGDIIFNEFITADNELVTIDVARRKESGDYSGDIAVNLKSNLASFTLEQVDWPEENSDGSLQILDSSNHPLENGATLEPKDGKVKLNVRFNDLNGTRELWKKNHTMSLVLKGHDYEGNEVKCTVSIYIISSNDTYKVHLYAPTWSHPHIYVYQCLQLPADVTYTHGGVPGKIVGYSATTAALEYDFTGGAAFMGWNVGEHNDPDDVGRLNGGFWFFTGNSAGGWNPGTANWTDHYYDLDFCETYRKTLNGVCSQCYDPSHPKNHDRGFPGIHMKSEGDGWWEFDLSGVATPGKAMIMFTDCKENSHAEAGNRYPAHEEPGVALFDYPSKEGWFYYVDGKANQTFVSYKPTTIPVTIYKYRIYWPYNSGDWQGLNVWKDNAWGDEVYPPSDFSAGNVVTKDTKGGASFHKYNDYYAYVEFDVQENQLSGNINYQRIKTKGKYDTEQPSFNASTFKFEDGCFHYTILEVGRGEGGKPSGVPTPPIPPTPDEPTQGSTTTTFEVGKTYALVFPGVSHKVWAWSDDNGDAYSANKNNGDWNNQATYNGVYTFVPTKTGATTVKYKLDAQDPEYNKNVSLFKYNTATKRYEATL